MVRSREAARTGLKLGGGITSLLGGLTATALGVFADQNNNAAKASTATTAGVAAVGGVLALIGTILREQRRPTYSNRRKLWAAGYDVRRTRRAAAMGYFQACVSQDEPPNVHEVTPVAASDTCREIATDVARNLGLGPGSGLIRNGSYAFPWRHDPDYGRAVRKSSENCAIADESPETMFLTAAADYLSGTLTPNDLMEEDLEKLPQTSDAVMALWALRGDALIARNLLNDASEAYERADQKLDAAAHRLAAVKVELASTLPGPDAAIALSDAARLLRDHRGPELTRLRFDGRRRPSGLPFPWVYHAKDPTHGPQGRFAVGSLGGSQAIKLICRGTSFKLAHVVSPNLQQTPKLSWTWRAESFPRYCQLLWIGFVAQRDQAASSPSRSC